MYFGISCSIGLRLASRLPCVSTTPRGSAVVPEVKTIWAVSSRVRGMGASTSPGRWASDSRRFSSSRCGHAAAASANAFEQTTSLASTSLATRCMKSGAAILSMGTATTPRSMHPRKAATHSGEFSPQSTTRSPFLISLCSNSRAKRKANSAVSP